MHLFQMTLNRARRHARVYNDSILFVEAGKARLSLGHQLRLMPARYVKPYVKANKNDCIDAEAIAGAVARPRMRFVPMPSLD